jgi:microcystin-dependent protein
LTVVQVGNSGLVVSPSEPSSTGVLWLDTDETSDVPVPIGGTAGQVLAKIDAVNYNTQWINQVVAPAGVISQFAGSAAPIGYLLCEGQSLSTTSYPDLFTVLGYTYGGSGSSFNIPNLKGRIPVGRDTAQTEFDALGEAGGEKAVTLAASQLPAHSHPNTLSSNTVAAAGHTHSHVSPWGLNSGSMIGLGPQNPSMNNMGLGSYQFGGSIQGQSPSINFGGGNIAYEVWSVTSSGNSANTTVGITNANNTGGGGAHNNLQPYVVVNYIIKT